MRRDRGSHTLAALLVLATAGTGVAQITNISGKSFGLPGYPMGLPIPRPTRPAATAMPPAPSTETVLHNFASPPHGAYPYGGVIRDSAGNIFGTATNGGGAGAGIVFKVDTAGHETVLYSFTGGADGANPWAGVIRDSAGNLYGTTLYGGTSGAGVVFKVDTTGHETVLYSFTGGADGGYLYYGLIRDSAGNLYGTAGSGAFGSGVVFKIDTAGNETVLYTFTGGNDGGNPNNLIRDPAGNLYGTTTDGGASGAGTVFKLDKTGNETVLYSFTGGNDGGYPNAGVTGDSAGNLYGTTLYGGTAGNGTVYKVDAKGNETVLYSFTGGNDGGNPYGGVIRDPAGNLYGTTTYGGPAHLGVVFKVDTAGNETVLYAFTNGPDGYFPNAGVIRDSAGNLYGTTVWGGAGGAGVVYKLDAGGQQTVLYGFPGATDGHSPSYAGLIRDSAGNFYGTTVDGGTAGAGIVYKLDAAGHETVLYTFTGGADGGFPQVGVIQDPEGNLYGTTFNGGSGCSLGCGVVFKVDPSGHETVLHTFSGYPADGALPLAGLVRDSAGNLYGTTVNGGNAYAGIVYKIDPAGTETVLYNFTGGSDGGYPQEGSLLRDPAGNLYGTTGYGGTWGVGVVFKLDPAGNETVLYNFTGGADGFYPDTGLISDPAGNLYGTAPGGANYSGVVYELAKTGQFTELYTFTGGADGWYPNAGVIRDAAGNLYGTTNGGGAYGAGVVFELNPSGQETVLYSFTGGDDGANPWGGVMRGPAGNLYGPAQNGGPRGAAWCSRSNTSNGTRVKAPWGGRPHGASQSSA